MTTKPKVKVLAGPEAGGITVVESPRGGGQALSEATESAWEDVEAAEARQDAVVGEVYDFTQKHNIGLGLLEAITAGTVKLPSDSLNAKAIKLGESLIRLHATEDNPEGYFPDVWPNLPGWGGELQTLEVIGGEKKARALAEEKKRLKYKTMEDVDPSHVTETVVVGPEEAALEAFMTEQKSKLEKK